jgi:Tfp pilus assembly protein FimT
MTRNQLGFSMIELMFVVMFGSIMMGIAGLNFMNLNNSLHVTANNFSGYILKSRSKAISSTYSYRIKPTTASKVEVYYGKSCNIELNTKDERMTYYFPEGVYLESLEWSVCFSPRGLSYDSEEIKLKDDDGDSRTIQVALGGGVRVLD